LGPEKWVGFNILGLSALIFSALVTSPNAYLMSNNIITCNESQLNPIISQSLNKYNQTCANDHLQTTTTSKLTPKPGAIPIKYLLA
jgi:hypothetical protein